MTRRDGVIFGFPSEINEIMATARLKRFAGMPGYQASMIMNVEAKILSKRKRTSDLEDIASVMRRLDKSKYGGMSDEDVVNSTIYKLVPLGLAGMVATLAGEGCAIVDCFASESDAWIEFYSPLSLEGALVSLCEKHEVEIVPGRRQSIRMIAKPGFAFHKLASDLSEELHDGVFPIQ